MLFAGQTTVSPNFNGIVSSGASVTNPMDISDDDLSDCDSAAMDEDEVQFMDFLLLSPTQFLINPFHCHRLCVSCTWLMLWFSYRVLFPLPPLCTKK